MAGVIEHEGEVARVAQDRVYVRIVAQSACASCRAREACGMGESEEKVVEVTVTDGAHFEVGEKVSVGVQRRTGGVAVALAYGGALVVLLGTLALGIGLGCSEGCAALIALGAVAGYYLLLWIFRRKIEHSIHFTITKR